MTKHCSACERLREENADFLDYGISNKECKSLQNDTGLNPDLAVLHNDCEDLNDMNDCLIGQHGKTIKAYDDCDWKKYAKDQNKNLWNMFKGIICAICGLWTNIHKIWEFLKYNVWTSRRMYSIGKNSFFGTVIARMHNETTNKETGELEQQIMINCRIQYWGQGGNGLPPIEAKTFPNNTWIKVDLDKSFFDPAAFNVQWMMPCSWWQAETEKEVPGYVRYHFESDSLFVKQTSGAAYQGPCQTNVTVVYTNK